MKIGFWEVKKDEEKAFFAQALEGHQLDFYDIPLDENPLPTVTDYDAISVFTSSKITPTIINLFPNLKLITVRATGYDNVNLETAKSKKIVVTNVPAYGSNTVAEYTFGLILSLARKIPQAVNRLKVGFDFSFEGLRGFDLHGKTLGVVGTGKIGLNVIKIAKGFNMKVMASDAFPNEKLAKELDFDYLSLEELLKQSDIVTLHVPLMEQTKHLINSDNIKLMKKGSLLINTSRGSVVETEGLFQALVSKQLDGAALDVLEEEVEIKEEAELLEEKQLSNEKYKIMLQNHILINLPNVIITPHMAFYTKEAEHNIWQTTVENIKSALSGNPQNIVISNS